MQKTVDYYLFLLSPWSYLGTQSFNQVVSKHNLKVNYKPIDVMQTFEKMGGVPPMKRHPSRQRLRTDELVRWSDYLGIPINLKPAFWPADQSLAAKMILSAQQQGQDPGALVDAVLTAVWIKEKNIADPETLIELADQAGLDGASLADSANTDEMAQLYQSTTEQAHSRDVFGSPTFIYKDEIFWGQDRIDFLDRALDKS